MTPDEIEEEKQRCFAREKFKQFNWDKNRVANYLDGREKKYGKRATDELRRIFRSEWQQLEIKSREKLYADRSK